MRCRPSFASTTILFLGAGNRARDGDFLDDLNPESLVVLDDCMLEPSLADPGDAPVQFERQGYFRPDPDSRPGGLVFNRVVALRDSWAKIQAKGS